jgi:hypothetical protein
MKSYFLVISLMIGILLGATGCYAYFLMIEIPKLHFNQTLGRAYKYLISSYNSTLGLCYVYPGSDIYWLSHDNVLASYVLQNWNREIADNISKTVGELAVLYGLERHPSGLLKDGRVDILLGCSYDSLKDINTTFERDYLGSKIKTETVENTNAQGIQGYADLLCYASLMEWRKQNYSGAQSYYDTFKEMWNPSTNGFEDVVFNITHKYETYKLALFYLLSKTIGEDFQFKEQLIRRIWECQDANGGFRTHYTIAEIGTQSYLSFPEDSCTNTETTSIILLADVPSLFEYTN